MLAYAILLLAVFSRLVPHFFHTPAWNFTALGGGLLFFGSRMGAGNGSQRFNGLTAIKLVSALAALIATDYYLTVYAYGYPFHVSSYLATWLWYAAVCLIGMGLLEKPTVLRVGAAALASSTTFFLLSNFVVWLSGSMAMYPHTLAGLGACYTAAIPFYRNDLVSTALTAGVLFGLPALAAKLAESLQPAQQQA